MLNVGSQWQRWDPHIHCPGTILNDEFRDDDAWPIVISSIESSTPRIRALGVTDYYLTDSYEKIRKFKTDGRLAEVELIFPNVEMRLGVSAKSGFVNVHLLVCPDDSDHIIQLKRFLSRLSFTAHGDSFTCNREDLIRLGKLTDPTSQCDIDALRNGATQFKINFDRLKNTFHESAWAKENILVAVAAGSGDGTSGINRAAGFTLRQEIEKFAHIIFSSSPVQREFWLGQRACGETELRQRYGGLKPCLHGSDAHKEARVGKPDLDRFTWLKGEIRFDALRQACIDPAGRAFVGIAPPATTTPSQVISSIRIENADWTPSHAIPLNPDLVTIIGARGSGKTALIEAIALGCDSVPKGTWQSDDSLNSSFLARACSLLNEEKVFLQWGSREEKSLYLDGRNTGGFPSFPRARYLSQQFVEELCSANSASDGLNAEIERVIFEAHSHDERDGALSFTELRGLRTERFRRAREREAGAIRQISMHIGTEIEKERLVDTRDQQVKQKKQQILRTQADRKRLVFKDSDALLNRYSELQGIAQTLRKQIENLKKRCRTLENLRDEVANVRATVAPEMLRQSKAHNLHSGLSDQQWEDFLLDYKGPVDEELERHFQRVNRKIKELTGEPPCPRTDNSAIINAKADLNKIRLATINAEIVRLEGQLKADQRVRKQYSVLSNKISQETSALQTLQTRLDDARSAGERRRKLQEERNAAYERIFDAIVAEQDALEELYSPLKARLEEASGTLQKLTLSVFRNANATGWAEYAEENLLDRRKAGPFKGQDALIEKANAELKPCWETGTAIEAKNSMIKFIGHYHRDLLAHAPVPWDEHARFRSWLGNFAQWLFSTNHITVHYGISYDGVSIENLSPGTRGIVLLLLYLALDNADNRPLIIDQPEENLDPKSVFDELVPLFLEAKAKRQVIMVTHNANLVINTDSDQVIVAEASPAPSGCGLPRLTYRAGGLEDSSIRKAVCDILEGGELAFQERARRLRLRLQS